ncbi:MauE/DoxX family redox-associated membrane protein [Thermomonospora cellulosilytica]|uniref:Methylamine utilisation protein MauE domain-containing protein n=1 Tax=Thermomonospora cellulosilytica TaxID=1411118 RepID=A0A7W3MUW5_9ACTN|nr:MauE/DoxX family redox-associated membrane protein [Thermomonospora cellulosilytica]MBA9002335.1 hypothetical protein [Thermomonospora cellulosilytica]
MDLLHDAQVLLLATVLALSGAAKLLSRSAKAPERPAEIHGVPVPAAEPHWAVALRHSRPATVALALTECLLAAALVVTPHPAVRIAAALLMVAATWIVAELRERTPDAGCGCFGDLSTEPVGRRSVVRAALLAVAALGTLGGARTALEIAAGGPWQTWLVFTAELALVAAVSPEPAELLRRRRRPPVPCDRRPSPLPETLSRLRRSPQWRHHRPALTAQEPVDVWREGCWRFLAYPTRDAEVVFAVSTAAHDRTVHATVLPPEDPPAPASQSPAQDAAPLRSDETSSHPTASDTPASTADTTTPANELLTPR